jgi:hypothetical protein
MYAVAIVGDVLGFLLGWIPGMSFIIGPLTAFGLYIVGSIEDVHLFSADNIVITIVYAVAEGMPFVSMVPLWTIRVFVAKRKAKRDKEAEGQSE